MVRPIYRATPLTRADLGVVVSVFRCGAASVHAQVRRSTSRRRGQSLLSSMRKWAVRSRNNGEKVVTKTQSPSRLVGLFVDWNSQILLAPEELQGNPVDRCKFALRSVGKFVAKHLCSLDSHSTFRVRLRLYHGWTAGITHTPNRRAIASLAEFESPDDIFPSRRVLALSDVEFGDRLIDALPSRENRGLGIHLPNTYRRQSGYSQPAEKMVDTALAADLLSWARSEPSSLAIVISPDDDVVPPIFIAEAWMKPFGGSVHLKRSMGRGESRFLALDGLLI